MHGIETRYIFGVTGFGLLIVLAEHHCVNFWGLTYSGKVSVTQQNIPCQRWDLQHPHIHVYTDPSMFPDRTLADAVNYCRVPNGNGLPWCYTTSIEQHWDYCDFEMIYWGMRNKTVYMKDFNCKYSISFIFFNKRGTRPSTLTLTRQISVTWLIRFHISHRKPYEDSVHTMRKQRNL